jgi:hypothetical protein
MIKIGTEPRDLAIEPIERNYTCAAVCASALGCLSKTFLKKLCVL